MEFRYKVNREKDIPDLMEQFEQGIETKTSDMFSEMWLINL